MKTDLKTLNLSTRVYNILFKVGIDTVEKLREIPDGDLTKIKGISTKSADEIKEKLSAFELQKVEEKAQDFLEDKTYIFTKKKYIKAEGRKNYQLNKDWVDSINGQMVDMKTKTIKDKTIEKKWCISK